MINQLVNQRYEVVEKLGESPLIVNYRALDQLQNRTVCLKTVLSPFDADPEFVEGFTHGMEASIVLKHPNIVQFEESGVSDGFPFAIVEFVRGINLSDRIRRIAPFSLSVATDYACAIAEALNHAHRLGQMHGDLRPQHILITSEGALKVSEFGVQNGIRRSKLAQETTLGLMAPYHAPELSTSHPGTAGGDIYATGAILYEMLTGAPLYSGNSPEAIADEHAFSAIPLPRVINPGVPKALEGIILKCLQKRPEMRYRIAAELLTDLKAVRDALRFGKPLSWSPIDIESASAAVARAAAPVEIPPPPPVRIQEPAAEVATPVQPGIAVMPARSNRLRSQGESVSLVLKMLIGFTAIVILGSLMGFAAVWVKYWVTPVRASLPAMEGRPISEIEAMAKRLKITLKEHGRFREKPARNIVYRTEPARGERVMTGHALNVWYSKGSEFVDVPNVAGLQRDDAEKKLKDAGLTVGRITQEFSEKIPPGAVLSQDVSFKKRVQHDTAVGLIISEGKKPDYADSPITSGDAASAGDAASTPAPEINQEAPPAENQKTHEFKHTLSVQRDGKSSRRVRVEYVDADGEHTPVINEDHGEGDKIPLYFEYRGKKITLRIFYDDQIQGAPKEFDPEEMKTEVHFSGDKP